MVQPGDLIVFIRTRLDEDERTAQRVLLYSRESYDRAPAESWVAVRRVNNARPPYYDYEAIVTERLPHTGQQTILTVDGTPGLNRLKADHVARFASPRRVLADIAAKRRIVDAAEQAIARSTADDHDPAAGMLAAEYSLRVLPALALPFASHPDYRQEWAPDDPA